MQAQANQQEQAITSSEQMQLNALFTTQKSYFSTRRYPTLAQRKSALQRLKNALLTHQDSLCEAMNKDFGHRSHLESKLLEVMTTIGDIKYTIHNLRQWMKPEKREVALQFMPASNTVLYQPLGVVGIIVPWNYPLYLSVGPLVSAIAAGNCAMMKMSEFTPAFNHALKTMLAECFDASEVCIVEGEANIAAAFSGLPFDHLLFTGSTSVGKHVMRAAAENLTPVTLELGGKSPAIIDHEISMKDAVERIVFGKCANAGQTCVAPDYLLVPKDRLQECIDALKARFAKIYPDFDNNPDYTSVINTRQFERLTRWLAEAESYGASVISCNGKAYQDCSQDRRLPLQLVANCPDETQVMQQEIFGPILPIVTYDSLDSAIEYISDRPRPLALYLLSHNAKVQKRISEQTHSGGLGINDTIVHVGQEDMPFGGIGPSGMGHYHGKEGFLTFSKAKAIHKKGRINSTLFINPPYKNSLLNLVLKLFVR